VSLKNIANSKKIQRHHKFTVFFGYYNDLVANQLVDVIKNPLLTDLNLIKIFQVSKKERREC